MAMSLPRPRLLKVAAFAAFVVLSTGVALVMDARPPRLDRLADGSYHVDLRALHANSTVLEGRVVVFDARAANVSWDPARRVLSFVVADATRGISFVVEFRDVATTGDGPAIDVRDGEIVHVRATSHLVSDGVLVGIDIHVLRDDLVYWASGAGAVILLVLLLRHFKVDRRRLAIVPGRAGRGTAGVAPDTPGRAATTTNQRGGVA